MSTRIAEIAGDLYRSGKITFGEAVAIIGSVMYVHDILVDEPIEEESAFCKSFGTIGVNNVYNLMKED